jgi:hypothetical protein
MIISCFNSGSWLSKKNWYTISSLLYISRIDIAVRDLLVTFLKVQKEDQNKNFLKS